MSSANSSLDSSHSAGDGLSRSYSMSTAERLRETVSSPRDYDGLKSQCDKAMHELQILRRQHSETVRRCEHTMKELEFYRGESIKPSPLDQAEQLSRFTSDISDLRAPTSSASASSSQENESCGGGDGLNHLYLSTVSKYEAMKEDYEALRKRYEDLISSHSTAVDKLELAQEEVGRLKKQCEEMVSERNVAVRERNGLKQQCTAAIRQWDMALREKNEYHDALLKVQQQHEEAVKEINQAMAVRMKASKDLKRLTEERNAAMHEYSLIMSERDTVHKEMEKLSEDLSQAFSKCKAVEAHNKQLSDEKKALCYQVETLKREIASALHDRDKALKECTDLKGKYTHDSSDTQRDSTLKRFSNSIYREREGGSKELGEGSSSSMDLFDMKCHKEKLNDIDQANQEIDRLLKHNDKLQQELHESLQEAEVCKRRRDWAFSERDKIVQERESIRTLCDRLRKERDRAVSDLAEALRDSDDIKKQRNETSKQLKVLKERMEAQLEKESRMVQLQSTTHNYSHDSAIDTDDCDTETLTIHLAGPETEDLGLELGGGREEPHAHPDSGVYVTSVSRGSISYNKLRPNDCILKINSVDCTNMSKRYVLDTLRSCGSTVVLVVRRRKTPTTQVQLKSFDHGLSLESGLYISRLSLNCSAARDGTLAVGDRIVTINNRSVEGLSAKEAQALLGENGDSLVLGTWRAGSNSAPVGGASYSVRQANASTQTLVADTSPSPAAPPPAPVYRPDPVANLPSESSCVGVGVSAWARQREEKKRNRNSSPLTFEQERDDAIAELDSVIDSYHQRAGASLRSTRANNGTWPKARGVAVVENGTIVERKMSGGVTKERMPLSALLNNYSVVPRCCDGAQPLRHSNPPPLDFTLKPGLDDYFEKKKVVGRSGSEDRHVHIHTQLYGPTPHSYPFPSYTHRHSHPHSPPPHHVPVSDTRFCFEPPYSTLAQYHHTHSPSVDSSHYHKVRSSPHPHHDDSDTPVYHYETGTFPRKRENQRFRVPSNPSVTSKGSGGKMSTSSIEKSERGSPMPQFHVEVLSPGHPPLRQTKASSLPDYCWPQKPLPGELRRVHIDKSCEPLGIQISCLDSGGVFVSTVSDQSLAAQVGLQVGDQLLEVCGINMRSATYKLAANVLRQCGNSITMLVQYSPDKYHELEGSGSSSGGSKTRSGSPTPCASPAPTPRAASPVSTHHNHTSTHHQAAQQLARAVSSLAQQRQRRSSTPRCCEDPRYLSIETEKCSNLGISLVGGNKVGIYVHSVQNNSLAYNAGLRTGDRILEYNGTDLREATAEEAAYELAKPADKVTLLVQYSIERYQDVRDKPGDSLYMRALFDRLGEQGDNLQLRFRKDDILYVDNTMFNGVPGAWRAWLVDDDGAKHTCGIIPSKYKVEEEMVLRRSLGDLEGDGRRGTRRSFFRRKKHQRTDSKELASFSNMAQLGWYSDSGSLHDDTPLASYQRVVRLDKPVFRPVVVVGPLSELVTEKLLQDFPGKFVRCVSEMMHCSQATMEKGVSDNLFVDYRKKGTYFEVTSVSSIKDMSDKNAHVVLDVGLASVERLLRHQIYPIVLLIKFKSTKQIKEIKETRYASDKVTAKAAKEMYEHALKLESEYRHYISAIIPAGVNIAYMCTQVKAAVDLEQNKTLWVPSQ